jgi:hypothetical protein
LKDLAFAAALLGCTAFLPMLASPSSPLPRGGMGMGEIAIASPMLVLSRELLP